MPVDTMFRYYICLNTKIEIHVLRVAIMDNPSKQLKQNNTKHKIVMSALQLECLYLNAKTHLKQNAH